MAQVYVRNTLADSLGYVAGLSWSHVYGEGPSGCKEAAFTVATPRGGVFPELARGSSVEICEGAGPVWWGLIREATRNGEVMEISAQGAGFFLEDYGARDGVNPTTRVDLAVNGAISRGWPIARVAGFPSWASTAVASVDTKALNTTAAVVTEGSKQNGVRWTVREDRVLRFETDQTTVKWVHTPAVGSLGVGDDDFYSHVGVRYLDSGTSANAVVWVGDDSATGPAAKWGRKEAPVDLTGLGPMTATKATSLANARLALVGARLSWTQGLDIPLAQLRDVNDIPAHASQVRAGDILRLNGIADEQGTVRPTVSTDIVIGEVRYIDGEASVYVEPLGLAARDFNSILADVVAQAADAETVTG